MKNQNKLSHGDWNAICDRCGFKYKASDLKKEWTGLRVCGACFDERHPQDFVKGVKDTQQVPWSRPEQTDSFLTVVTLGDQNTMDGTPVSGASNKSSNANFQYTNAVPASYQRYNTTTGTLEYANFFTGFEPIESV